MAEYKIGEGYEYQAAVELLREHGVQRAPTKNDRYFTPEKLERIYSKMVRGTGVGLAAECSGVPESVVLKWMQMGNGGNPKYAQFANRVRILAAESECTLSDLIYNEAADGNWKAAAYILENKYPKNWVSKRTELHQTNVNTTTILTAEQTNAVLGMSSPDTITQDVDAIEIYWSDNNDD